MLQGAGVTEAFGCVQVPGAARGSQGFHAGVPAAATGRKKQVPTRKTSEINVDYASWEAHPAGWGVIMAMTYGKIIAPELRDPRAPCLLILCETKFIRGREREAMLDVVGK